MIETFQQCQVANLKPKALTNHNVEYELCESVTFLWCEHVHHTEYTLWV